MWHKTGANRLHCGMNYPHQSRLLGVELLRFVSAMAILLWHYQHFFVTNSKTENLIRSAQPLYSILFLFYDYGFYAVQVFWLISGFIFFHNYAERIARKQVSAREFFVLRISRLYPLHFATLLLVAILQSYYLLWNGNYFIYPLNDLRHFILNLCFASTWGFQTGDSFNAPVWSVSVEVLVYAVFFCITILIKPRFLIVVSVVAVSAVLVASKLPWREFSLCLFYFYLGGIVWLVLAKIRQCFQNTNALLIIANSALLVLLMSAAAILNLKEKSLFIATATPILIILAQLIEDTVIAGKHSRRFIIALGNLTYSSYLLHFPIQLLCVTVLSQLGIDRQLFYDWRIFLCFICITLLSARLTYVYFEHPAQDFIRKLLLEHTDRTFAIQEN